MAREHRFTCPNPNTSVSVLDGQLHCHALGKRRRQLESGQDG